MNELQRVFEGHPFRMQEDDRGEIWFVAKDVCDILELTNPTVAIASLDEDERSKLFLGRQGEANVINESGLYTLIIRSNKPTAGQFRKWVTSVVLPSIRKTGGYQVDMFADVPKTRTELAFAWAQEVEKNEKLEAEKAKMLPDWQFAQEIKDSPSLLTTEEVAKCLGLGAQTLNQFLIERGVLRGGDGEFKLPTHKMQKYVHEYYKIISFKYGYDMYGDPLVKQRVKWTQPGKQFLMRLWNKYHSMEKAG